MYFIFYILEPKIVSPSLTTVAVNMWNYNDTYIVSHSNSPTPAVVVDKGITCTVYGKLPTMHE